jgi:hypothetical protein
MSLIGSSESKSLQVRGTEPEVGYRTEESEGRAVRAILPHKRLEGLQREGNDSGLTQTSGLT